MFRRALFVVGLAASLGIGGFFAGSIVQGQNTSPVLKGDPTSFRDVVKAVLPAVVSVDSKAIVKPGGRRPARSTEDDEDQVPDNFRRFFEDLENRQRPGSGGAAVEQSIGFGSGFIIDAKGVILTNYHVVEGAKSAEITLGDGRKFTSRDIKGDQRTDLAIIRIDPKGSALPSIQLGDSSQMEIGDRVLAVGAPFGLTGTV